MKRPNVIRRTVVWWFAPPNNPFVTVNLAIDATEARAYLARVARPDRRITMSHLVAACIARTLTEHPYANGRVVGQRLVFHDHVGIAMPVNLLGKEGLGRELSMASIEAIDTMTLAELAAKATRGLRSEREGKPQHPVMKAMMGLGEAVPHSLYKVGLHAVDRAVNAPHLGDRLFRYIGITTALSNVGSTIKPSDGLLFRGADLMLPSRLMQVGTFWGTSAVQDEVIPIGGVPTVRPMLPVVFLFDHRVIDGVRASKVLQTFAEHFRAPEASFGAEADGRIGASTAS